MEKKYPPRVWIAIANLSEGDPEWFMQLPNGAVSWDKTNEHDVEFISKEEHDALISPLLEALEFYSGEKDDSLDWEYVNNPAVIQDRGKLAREALENHKNKRENR